MAFVLALLIVGWLLAFAVGAQTGFDNEVSEDTTPQTGNTQAAPAAYEKAASVS